jgi:hypothetical protein
MEIWHLADQDAGWRVHDKISLREVRVNCGDENGVKLARVLLYWQWLAIKEPEVEYHDRFCGLMVRYGFDSWHYSIS